MTTLVKTTVCTLLILGIGGCSNSPGTVGGVRVEGSTASRTAVALGADIPSPDASAAASTCIVGWWLSPPAPCASPSTTAEAKASDCQSVGFVEYLANGTAIEGVYSRSPSLGTMSGVFGATTYVLNGNALQVLPGTHAAQVSCTSSQLSMDGQTLASAPQSVANALAAVTAGDGSACPVASCFAPFGSVAVE